MSNRPALAQTAASASFSTPALPVSVIEIIGDVEIADFAIDVANGSGTLSALEKIPDYEEIKETVRLVIENGALLVEFYKRPLGVDSVLVRLPWIRNILGQSKHAAAPQIQRAQTFAIELERVEEPLRQKDWALAEEVSHEIFEQAMDAAQVNEILEEDLELIGQYVKFALLTKPPKLSWTSHVGLFVTPVVGLFTRPVTGRRLRNPSA